MIQRIKTKVEQMKDLTKWTERQLQKAFNEAMLKCETETMAAIVQELNNRLARKLK